MRSFHEFFVWRTRLFGENHDFNLDEVLKEISYFRGSAYYIKEFCFDGHVKCPKSGFSQLAKQVPLEYYLERASTRGMRP